jgi:RNA polymerase sigma factor (sigma-70 family)
MPPPAEGFASRFFLGPTLRAQPDRRLVTLVREGYEAAFEEIVRRYGRPLGRYAASIVGGRSEDVLQDAFAKALPALRRDDAEIDLRPWLFRIVRNTALNDLRDSPPSAEVLAEALAGGRNPAEELERREELADLMTRLQALPEAQRAAIVMRELEGLGHEEIAAALGLSDGGARQAIYRARQALREGAALLLPLPLVRLLIDHGAGTGASGAIAAAGASAGGAGASGALKLGFVAAVVAGSVGAGVAVQDHKGGDAAGAQAVPAASRPNRYAASLPASARAVADRVPIDQLQVSGDGHGDGRSDHAGHSRGGGGQSPGGRGRHGEHGSHPSDDGPSERGRGPDRHDEHSGPGSGGGDDLLADGHQSGRSESGSGESGGDSSSSGGSGSGGDSGSESGSGSGASPPPEEEVVSDSSDGSSGGGDGSGRSGSNDGLQAEYELP